MASAAYQITVLSLAAATCQECLPCHEEPIPWLCLHCLASWPETDVRYLTTDIGKMLYLCIMGKCQIPLLQNK